MTASRKTTAGSTAARTLAGLSQERLARSLLAMLEKVDFVFAGQQVRCKLGQYNNFPAWSTGRTATDPAEVCFDPVAMGPLRTDDDWLSWLAANAHEVAHLVFTPNLNMAHGPAPREFLRVFTECTESAMILEDQRIETFMAGMFPSMANYYRISFSRFCLGPGTEVSHAWILAHGRKFLDPGLVKDLRGVFDTPRPGLIDEAAAIIDEYRLLDLSKHQQLMQASRLVEQFHKLWEELMEHSNGSRSTPKHSPKPAGGCDVVPYGSNTESSDRSKEASEKAKQEAEKEKEERPDEDGEEESSSGGQNDQDADDEDEEGDEQGQGSGSGGENKEDSESSQAKSDPQGKPGGEGDSDEQGGDAKGGTGAGTGDGPTTPSIPDILDKMAQDLADMSTQGDVAAEVQNMRQRVKTAPLNNQYPKHSSWVSFPDMNNAIVRGVATALERARADADPGWQRAQPTGRLNIGQAMAGADIDTMFDRWHEGNNDASDIEWVIALDGSSSMSGTENVLSMSAWALKRAADQVGIGCTVFRYANTNDSQMVYHSTDKAVVGKHPYIHSDGGTQPFEVLEEAIAILTSTRRTKKLFTVLTDGEWMDPNGRYVGPATECDAMVAAMNNIPGCVTSMVFLRSSEAYYMPGKEISWHNCQLQATIDKIEDLTGVARQWVAALMRKR